MANTTISIRSSGDTGVTPSLGVLANGELALNFADGILYYKTASNTLGTITTTEPAGLNKEVQFNDSGSFGSNAGLTFDKTTGTFTVPSLNVASVYSLPTTDGTNGQLLTTDGSGTITFQDAPTPPANVSISTFSGIGDGSTTEYNIGFRPLSREALLITIGGVLQDPDTAYTIDQDNNTVTFTSAPSNTAPISVVSLYTNVTPIGPADVIVSNFITTANGVVDTFDLGFNPVSANNLTVAVDGVLQTPTVHYTVNTTANTITFDSIPPNSANISVVSLYTNINTYADVIGTAAYAHANGAFDTANTNATTDFTNVSITAGDYGSAVIIPVVHLEANGRVSSVTNTSITSGTTSDAGIVQLTDATNSTSTTTAATPNSVKSAYDLADTANTNAATAQSTADGAQTHAEGAFTQANTDVTNVSVSADTYGNSTAIPSVTVEANGRVSAITTTSISIPETYNDANVVALLSSFGSNTITTTGDISVGGLTVDTNTLYVDPTNNRVGVGTATPAYQFEIENTGSNALLVLNRTDGASTFIEGGASNSVLGSVGANDVKIAYNSVPVVTIGAGGAITTSGNVTAGNLRADNFTTENAFAVVGSDNNLIQDTTLSVDPSSNYLGINQTSPEVTLHMTGEGAQTAQIRMEQYNDSADAPDVRTRRYRGTIASPSAVQSGDYLFRSNHEYYNGTSLLVGGAFAFDNTNNANRTQFSVAVDTDGTGADPSGTNGQFKIDGNDSGAITFNNAYKFPTSDGSANQVLQTDGSGTLSFASVSSGGNAFSTINLNDSTNVVADSSTDTLNLDSSGLISITGDASTDTITVGTVSSATIPFLKADGSSSDIDLQTSGTIGDVISNLHIPFTLANGTGVTTLVVA